MEKKRGLFFQVLILIISIFISVASAEANILVVSPHPDDDLITSAGIIYSAVQRGEQVRVVYMTNGDLFGGTNQGYERENEAVAGEGVLGVSENNLTFLGYPDGYLSTI